MKLKTTKRAVLNNYSIVISVSYCQLQHLLNYMSPFAYTTRVEGWACDVYDLGNGIALSTGYSPFGIKLDYKTLDAMDEQSINATGDERKVLIEKLKSMAREAVK